MISCLTENDIEKIIWGFKKPNEATWKHIFQCDRCLSQYKVLHQLFLQETSHALPTHNFSKIILLPLENMKNRQGRYRLAAKGDNFPDKYDIWRFGNKNKDIVCRIFHDRIDHQVSLYLIAENKNQISGRRITLFGEQPIEIITDDKGYAFLGVHQRIDFSHIEVYSPIASFDLTPIEVKSDNPDQIFSCFLKNDRHDEIAVEIVSADAVQKYRISIKRLHSVGQKKQLQIFACTDTKKTLTPVRIEKGVTVFETSKPDRILKIHIFSDK